MEKLDRRQFIQRAGLGAGAAGALWVAPSVLGFDAAFAGTSCVVTDTLSWLTRFPGGILVPSGLANPINFPITAGKPAINVTLGVANVGNPTLDATNFHSSVFTPNPPGDSNNTHELGGIVNNSWLNLQFETRGMNRGEKVTFTFSAAVTNLVFSLYDVDQTTGGGAYQDSVTINPPPQSFLANTPANISGAGAPFLGNGGLVANTSPAGNITLITIPGPLTTLTITYIGTVNSTSNQVVGIGDMKWCR